MKNGLFKTVSLLTAAVLLFASIPFSTTALEVQEKFEYVNSYIDDDPRVPGVDFGDGRDGAGELPASYDNRTGMTAVKNQGSHGTCWAFSAVGSCEANLVKKGLANTGVDFSELQMAYYQYHKSVDPLGNYSGDYAYLNPNNTSYDHLNRGGTHSYVAVALARWDGLVNEEVMPYSDAEFSLSYDYPEEYSSKADAAHLENAYFINIQENPDELKQMILDYGSATTSYYSDDIGWNSNEEAYYQTTYTGTNHGICIVGWDDNYSRTNFKSSLQPANNGAWLIRNSWGTWNHGDGYFWISYEDASLQDRTAFIFDVEGADNYDNNYQYDGGVISAGWRSNYFSNVFTANGSENLEAVSFALSQDVNVSYQIKIYKNPTNPNNPASGTLVSDATTSGQTTFAGYYTVELANPAPLNEGDVFAVVIQMSMDGGNRPAVDADYSMENDDSWWIWSHAECNEGESFYSYNGTSWSSASMNLRIKAFTTNSGMPSPENFSADLNSGTVSLSWDSVQDATSYEVYSNTNDAGYVLLGETTGCTYSYAPSASDGIAINYKVRAKNSETSSIFSMADAVRLSSSTSLSSFSLARLNVEVGTSKPAVKTFSPATATDKFLTYYTDDESIATVSRDGTVTGVALGETTLRAISRNGLRTASATVTVGTHTHTTYVSKQAKAPSCTEDGWTEEVKCNTCGATVTESTVIASTGHTPYVSISAQAATCTEDGWTVEEKCSVCQEILIASMLVPKTGHTSYVSKAAQAATCTEDGWTNEEKCSVCQEILTASTLVPKTGHTSYVSIAAKNPTCTDDGWTIEEKCRTCEALLTASTVIAATGHTSYVSKAAQAATCTEDGWTVEEKCSVCSVVLTASTVIAATGHTSYISKTAQNPTCTENGRTIEEKCRTCEVILTASTVIPATGHTSYVSKTAQNPTCTENGRTIEEKCRTCEVILTASTVIAATGHTSYVSMAAQNPTCTEDGWTIEEKCRDCEVIFTVSTVIAATGHTSYVSKTAQNPTCTEDGWTVEEKCSVCEDVLTVSNAISKTGHTAVVVKQAKAATCTETGCTEATKCSVCDETLSVSLELPMLGHKNEVTKQAKAATCTENGWTAEISCSVCHELLVQSETQNATGHSYSESTKAPSCTEDGYTTHTCSLCSDSYTDNPVTKLGHDYSATVKAANCTENGYTTHTCSRCSASYRDGEVAALGHNDSDSNGYCDLCGADLSPSANCSCRCHSTGFNQFIYKIMRFFWKLFGTNKTCECGASHY